MDLLTVELPGQLRVRLRGPHCHRHLADASAGTPDAHLAVSAAEATIVCARPDGTEALWEPGASGPHFYEDTRYRLTVENLAGTGTPQLVHRYPGLLNEVDRHEDQQLLTASLNFGRSVGVSTLSIRAGTIRLDIEIEVFPTKLDYETDFTDLLHEVSSAARGLALEYLRATFIRGGTEDAAKPAGLEWLVLLRNQIGALEQALRYITDHPHRVLERYTETLPIERIRRPDGAVRRAAIRGLGSGELRDVPGIGPLRPRLPAQQTRETLNTPEHRWLRHQLELVESRLAEIHGEMEELIQRVKARGRSVATLEAEKSEIADFLSRIHLLRRLAPLAEAVGPPPTGAPSLTLLTGIGYRESYRALLTLRLGLSLDGEAIDFSLKDLHVLYETWCFLRLSQLIAEVAGEAHISGDVISTGVGGVRVRLKTGISSKITFAGDNRELHLLYNPIYDGITGLQQPDVVLEFLEDGWPRIIVVFDAKYRLSSDKKYVESWESPGPPIEAVNALHRYRDAIVVNAKDRLPLEEDVTSFGSPQRGRPVVKGVALFPLTTDLATQFAGKRLHRALGQLGVGAIPFTPTSTDLVKTWLKELLELPVEQLAIPGPPFLAWEHLRSAASP